VQTVTFRCISFSPKIMLDAGLLYVVQ
jgi:hypothetical protein